MSLGRDKQVLMEWSCRGLSMQQSTGDHWSCTTGSAPMVARFRSKGVADGWVRESAETSGVGGSHNSAADFCRVGDDASDRQYRTILSFKTARLPDDAVIDRVVLKVQGFGGVGEDPFDTHSKLAVDIVEGTFSDRFGLQNADFEAIADLNGAGTLRAIPVNGWHKSNLKVAAHPYVNLTGHTPLRLRFNLGDDDDQTADYLDLLCGDWWEARFRPMLIVTYHTP